MATAEAVRHVLRVRRVGRASEAMLVISCSNQDSPLKVPLRFLDPKARPRKGSELPTPPREEHGHRH